MALKVRVLEEKKERLVIFTHAKREKKNESSRKGAEFCGWGEGDHEIDL